MLNLTGKKAFWRVALSALVLSGVLLVSVAPALAAGPEALPQPQGTDEQGAPRLEYAYRRLLHAAEGQAMHLDHARDMVGRAQEWIDKLAEQGQDVSELQAALDAFEVVLGEAQAYHGQAMAVLETHAGFDENGKVTDRGQAIETLRQAGRALRDAQRTLKDGTIDLRRAVGDWRREHRPKPATS